MADVFLSYRNTETRRAIVRRLATALRAHDFSVWWDYGLEAGENFRDRILQELATARAIVPLWCSESVTSKWVLDEAALGKERGCLRPARLQRITPPSSFADIHASDLIGWDGAIDSPKLREFIQTLGDAVGREARAPRDMLEELSALPPVEPLESMREVATAESFRVFSHYGLFGNQAHAKVLLETAGPIDIMGLSLLSFHTEADEPLATVIRQRARDGVRIRVLVADPANETGLSQILPQSNPPALSEVRGHIASSIAEWRRLAALHGNIELRAVKTAVIRHVASITRERAVLSFYWYSAPASTDRPSIICKPSSAFHELIVSEFEALWSISGQIAHAD